MYYLIISFSHKNSDIKTREKLAFKTDKEKTDFLDALEAHESVNESVLLSTCNRVEIIASVKDPFLSSERIFSALSKHSGISMEELEGRADTFEDNGAVHHLFSVASSLDSLVVGETQISGQLKEAFKFSYDRKYCSQKLSRAMHFAFKCAAEIRNSTDISKNPVSVASTAVVNAKEVMGDLGGEVCVVVGAGEMSELAAKHLSNQGCNIILVNRDVKKADALAKEVGDLVSVEPFSKLKELVNRYKLLITATGAPHTVITNDMVDKKPFRRYWFDLALPRDIDDIEMEDIEVFRIDDLKDIVEKNIALREEQAKEAYSIIGKYVMEFFKWLQTLQVDPLIVEMRHQAKEASMKELERYISKGFLKEEDRDCLEKLLHGAFNTFLHKPTTKLKDIADEPVADMVVEAVKMLFDINKEVKMIDKYKCEEHMHKMKEEAE